MSFLIAYVSFPDKQTAEQIIGKIVEQKLAACGNSFPISSTFWWESKLQNEDEYVGILKTSLVKWAPLVRKIEEIHPYDVPCIMKIEVEANEAYEKWIKDCVS